jgi:hypothetical protein
MGIMVKVDKVCFVFEESKFELGMIESNIPKKIPNYINSFLKLKIFIVKKIVDYIKDDFVKHEINKDLLNQMSLHLIDRIFDIVMTTYNLEIRIGFILKVRDE